MCPSVTLNTKLDLYNLSAHCDIAEQLWPEKT